jgi:glycosyltransferase involved in cell wall biosynthesis
LSNSANIIYLTILIPNFRTEFDLVIRAIKSGVVDDDRFYLKIVVWDDGSGSSYNQTLLARLEEEGLRSHITFLRSNSNKGSGTTRDLLLETVHTDFYMFLDADDFLLPGWNNVIYDALKIEGDNEKVLRLPFIAQTNSYCNYDIRSDSEAQKVLKLPSTTYSRYSYPVLTEGISPTLWATIYPKSTLDGYSNIMTGLRNFEDVVFSQYLYERFGFVWLEESAPVYSYTVSQAASITGLAFQSSDTQNITNTLAILSKSSLRDHKVQIVLFIASYVVPSSLKKIGKLKGEVRLAALLSLFISVKKAFRCYDISIYSSSRLVLAHSSISFRRKLLFLLVSLWSRIIPQI